MKTSAFVIAILISLSAVAQANSPAPQPNKVISEVDCTAARLGSAMPVSAIGFPVSAVTLNPPAWHAEANGNPAYCSVEGSMEPVDRSTNAKPIRFGVALPASWSYRAAQLGGGGINGSIPALTAGPGRGTVSFLARGFVTYGSDSGHQNSFGGPGAGRGGPPHSVPTLPPVTGPLTTKR